jgi:hypothetical protein
VITKRTSELVPGDVVRIPFRLSVVRTVAAVERLTERCWSVVYTAGGADWSDGNTVSGEQEWPLVVTTPVDTG